MIPRQRPPGALVKLRRLWWEGMEPRPGDFLVTQRGRRYRIESISGKTLRCRVLKPGAPLFGRVFLWTWGPRCRRRAPAVP